MLIERFLNRVNPKVFNKLLPHTFTVYNTLQKIVLNRHGLKPTVTKLYALKFTLFHENRGI